MIAIIDYGVGNLFSLQSSLRAIGAEARVTKNVEEIRNSDKILLPGVGAFSDAAQKLRESGLQEVVLQEVKNGKPLLGICLGMQLLFDKSFEYGEHQGLGLIKGQVQEIAPLIDEGLKVPHIGWNGLLFPKNKAKSKLYRYVEEGECVYFVHSFAAVGCEDSLSASVEYGGILTASVEQNNVYGVQFHPEKSGTVGLSILRAFNEL